MTVYAERSMTVSAFILSIAPGGEIMSMVLSFTTMVTFLLSWPVRVSSTWPHLIAVMRWAEQNKEVLQQRRNRSVRMEIVLVEQSTKSGRSFPGETGRFRNIPED